AGGGLSGSRWVVASRRVGVESALEVDGSDLQSLLRLLCSALGPEQVDSARCNALQGGAGHHRAWALFLEQVVDDLVSEMERQTSQESTDFEEELKGIGIDLDRMFAGSSSPAGSGSAFATCKYRAEVADS